MLDVRVRVSRRAAADAAVMERIAAPLAFAAALAARLRVRVQQQARPASPAPAYSSRQRKSRPYLVDERYAVAAGVPGTKWRSSAAFHAAARARSGSAATTGGMWQGLQARNYGGDRAIVDFTGSSLGADPTPGKTAGGKVRKRAPKVRNALKALAVLKSQGVHVTEPTASEVDAMGSALARAIADGANRVLGGVLTSAVADGDPAMYREALRRLARIGG